MNTPICDFVRQYAQKGSLRLHMPGHKGQGSLGCEALDITEISGADSLYEASGIIAQSEQNASGLFGCPTFYSTEGASQCIRAMVQLASLWARERGRQPHIAAGRNAHKTFLTAAALLDVSVTWLQGQGGYLSCAVSPEELEEAFRQQPITALYITSPDYLGGMENIAALAEVVHRHDALLLVDGAHGAYLRFLGQHPMEQGADLCCTSAHKTLPVLTGGAYLHAREAFVPQVRSAKALFGSTSPSYLILQSLDACNVYLADHQKRLQGFLPLVEGLRQRLTRAGFRLYGSEPMKLTVLPKAFGYTGPALAGYLEERSIVCEFADPDHLVLMLTPEIGEAGLRKLENALLALPRRQALCQAPPEFSACERVCSIRQAMLSPSEQVPAEKAVGRVLADPSVGCPPAVPIVMCGERISCAAAEAFRYYGIETLRVMK